MSKKQRQVRQWLTTTERHHHRQIRTKGRIRGSLALSLIIVWGLTFLTGFLLYVLPGGETVVLFVTKGVWVDVHIWVGVAAFIVTAVHLFVERKGAKAALRFLISSNSDSRRSGR